MQHDEHIWAWRIYRFHMRGFWSGLQEIGVIERPRVFRPGGQWSEPITFPVNPLRG